jgi:hypothetical protein
MLTMKQITMTKLKQNSSTQFGSIGKPMTSTATIQALYKMLTAVDNIMIPRLSKKDKFSRKPLKVSGSVISISISDLFHNKGAIENDFNLNYHFLFNLPAQPEIEHFCKEIATRLWRETYRMPPHWDVSQGTA